MFFFRTANKYILKIQKQTISAFFHSIQCDRRGEDRCETHKRDAKNWHSNDNNNHSLKD